MRDAMIDLETLGLRPGCAVLSIGVRQFDPTSDAIGAAFYAKITRESCEKAGLHVEPETVRWWDQQSAAARDEAFSGGEPLEKVAKDFVAFWRDYSLVRPWSQGANYDQPLWEAALRAAGVSCPYKFWDSRCTRTAYGMAGLNTKTVPRKGTHHKAIDDCDHQILCVQRAFKMLGLNH